LTKKIAIIGSGIVGSSAAYFLSKNPDNQVTIFDEGTGQATKASAGIISPWLSRRRNKKWYALVKKAAAFYPEFLKEVADGEPIPSKVYKQVGTLLFKKKHDHLYEMLEIGKKRRENAPEIGELKVLSPEEVKEMLPIYDKDQSALWAAGGARVDGNELVSLLLEKALGNGSVFVPEKAYLTAHGVETYAIKSENTEDTFDQVVLANSAWLGEFLEPFDYTVDVHPQKGQLVELKFDGYNTDNWPVVMPAGEGDFIPFENGKAVVGATHEDEMAYDLTINKDLLNDMVQGLADKFSSKLTEAEVTGYRSGTRAYTTDFSPFFGQVPGMPDMVAASGLGATGLTAGPLVGKILAEYLSDEETSLPLEDYPIENYVKENN